MNRTQTNNAEIGLQQDRPHFGDGGGAGPLFRLPRLRHGARPRRGPHARAASFSLEARYPRYRAGHRCLRLGRLRVCPPGHSSLADNLRHSTANPRLRRATSGAGRLGGPGPCDFASPPGCFPAELRATRAKPYSIAYTAYTLAVLVTLRGSIARGCADTCIEAIGAAIALNIGYTGADV